MLTPEQQLQRLDAAVKLTDDQKAKVIEIYKKAVADAQALRGGGGGGRQEMMAKGQEIQKAAHDQIRALLTADQQTKFDAMPTPPPGGRGGRRGGRRGGAGGPGGGEAPPPPPAAPAT
jgi:Spy/CpxP family protein refolding chaperone